MAEDMDVSNPQIEPEEATEEEEGKEKDAELVFPKAEPSLSIPDNPTLVVQHNDENITKTNSVSIPVPDSAQESLESPTKSLNVVQSYRIPGYAGWFSWSKIHSIEKRAMAEFFDGRSASKTPKLYKDYRDFIINRYKANPSKLLTFTEVRKMLVGDVNAIRRVFDFVEYWGLINYHITPENKQQAMTSESAMSSIKSETIVTVAGTAATKLASSAQMNDKPASTVSSPITGAETAATKLAGSAQMNDKPASTVSSPSLISYKDTFVRSAALDARTINSEESINKHTTFTCSTCQAKCLEKYYECKDKAGFLVCQTCFSSSESISKDSLELKDIKISPETSSCDWTRQEILRLLEAVGKYGENWDLVVHHVGTKSKPDCIVQFMKMPFGDQFVVSNSNQSEFVASSHITSDITCKAMEGDQKEKNNNTDAPDQHCNDEQLESEPPLKRNRQSTKLADAGNPILAQVASLSSMVGPRIAVSAARAALAALAEEDPLASHFLSSAVSVQTSISQAASKGNIKAEDEQKEDVASCKESMQAPKDGDTEAVQDALASVTQIRAGIATAIGAVAANAKLLADQEEREIELLMATIIENQLKKLVSKVKHFEELELMLKWEHSQASKAQAQVLADCIRFSHHNYSSGPG